MAITELSYSKEFISETKYEKGIYYHDFSRLEPYQTVSKIDEELRKKIINTFALKSGINTSYWDGKAEGYDGKNYYIFNFTSKFPKIKKENVEMNINYNSIVEIKKAGNKQIISLSSDLEDFLIESGFKKESKELENLL